MKNAILFTISLAVLGCGPQENAEHLKAVNYSLENANNSIRDGITSDYLGLSGKRMSPYMAEQAEEWLPRSNWIRQKADSISGLIENVKTQVIAQSDSLRKENVTVVKQLYDVNGLGYQLVDKLTAFKDSVPLVIHTNEAMDLLKNIPLLPGYKSSLSEEQRTAYKTNWVNKNFSSSSSPMAMVMLSKIENDVLISEKKLIEYCHMHVSEGCGLRFDEFESVALLSSSYIKKGQTIKLRAGIGAFTNAPKPKIFIDGKEMPLIGPTIAYEFKPAGGPGKHILPVKFEFYKPDGTIESKTEVLEYIIADEK